MTLDILNLEKTLVKFGDQSDSYTEEEEEALRQMYELIDNDSEMQVWRKYAQRNLLIIGIRASQLNVKKAFKTMKKLHLHATKTYPEMFAQVDPLNLEPLIRKRMFQVVKRPVDEGPAIVVSRIKHWDPAEASIEQISMVGALYVYAVAKISPEIQRKGVICVSDVAGFRLAHARQASLDLIVKSLRLYSTVPPLCKGLFAINSLFLFEQTYNLFKWILPQHIRNIIHVTRGSVAPVNKLVPAERLPKELGGTIPNEEAYIDTIEEDILKDPQLFQLIKHIQDEVLSKAYGKRKHSITRKNSKH